MGGTRIALACAKIICVLFKIRKGAVVRVVCSVFHDRQTKIKSNAVVKSESRRVIDRASQRQIRAVAPLVQIRGRIPRFTPAADEKAPEKLATQSESERLQVHKRK